jgi:hypothetical protein
MWHFLEENAIQQQRFRGIAILEPVQARGKQVFATQRKSNFERGLPCPASPVAICLVRDWRFPLPA